MAATISTRARWGNGGHLDPAAVIIAPDVGLTPRSAEHLLRGPRAVNVACARIIEAFHALGDHERLVRFLQPIDLAIAKARPAELSTDLVLREQETDGEEDTVEALYALEPTDDHARMYVRRIDKMIAASLRLRNAIAARHHLLPASPLRLA